MSMSMIQKINTVAYYYKDSYSNYKNAINNNDFETYQPDVYIFNELYGYIDAKGNETYYSSDEFIKYTADNEEANHVIINAFNHFELLDNLEYRLEDTEIKVIFSFIDPLIADEYVKYVFYFENLDDVYTPYKVETITSWKDCDYVLTMYYTDTFNIVIPSF